MHFLVYLFGLSRRELLGSVATVPSILLPSPLPVLGLSEAPALEAVEANPTLSPSQLTQRFIESQFEKDAQVVWPLDGLPATTPFRYAFVQGRVPPPAPPLAYPRYMDGTFTLRATFKKVSFPQSSKALSSNELSSLPGYRQGSCIMLPNVGASPAPYTQRFLANGGKVYADHAFNNPRRLEAGCPGIQLGSVRNYPFVGESKGAVVEGGVSCYVSGNGCTDKENPGLHLPSARFGITYSGQTALRDALVQQTVDTTVIAVRSTMGQEGIDQLNGNVPFYAAQTFIQDDIEQGQQSAYTEFLQLYPPQKNELAGEQGTNSGAIKGKLRVAAFLSGPPPESDPNAAGSDSRNSKAPDRRAAIALYDYDLLFEPSVADV
jgi:hypothetical protein